MVSNLILAGESNNKEIIESSETDNEGGIEGSKERELSKKEETPSKDGLRRVREREREGGKHKVFLEAEEA